MTTTIFVSDDGWYLTEAEAREVSHLGSLPTEIRVPIGQPRFRHEGRAFQPVYWFRLFRAVLVEVKGAEVDEEDVAVAVGRRVRPWNKRMVLPAGNWEFKLAFLVKTAPQGTTFIVDGEEKREKGLLLAAAAKRPDLAFLVEEGAGA